MFVKITAKRQVTNRCRSRRYSPPGRWTCSAPMTNAWNFRGDLRPGDFAAVSDADKTAVLPLYGALNGFRIRTVPISCPSEKSSDRISSRPWCSA